MSAGNLSDQFSVFLDIEIETTYAATGYHIFWTKVFTIIICLLGTIFLTLLGLYYRLNWVYQEYESTAKKGEKLMTAIDESEYNKFLIIERERIDFLNDKPLNSRPK